MAGLLDRLRRRRAWISQVRRAVAVIPESLEQQRAFVTRLDPLLASAPYQRVPAGVRSARERL
jgi:hypothetical protein